MRCLGVEIYRNVAVVEEMKVVCWGEYVLSHTLQYRAACVEASGVEFGA
jgi:hypothetical protein